MKWKAFAVGAGVVVAGMLLRGPISPDRVPRREEGKPIRVEVLNGTNVPRAAQGLAERLRKMGFDVVDIRNADRSDYQQTMVLDRVGVPRYARAVARKLDVGAPVRSQDGDLLLEVTVILGRDLAERFREDRS